MKKLLILALTFSICSAKAQVTVSSGDHVVELGTFISTYLNFRNIKDDASNQNKNKDRFKLRDARLMIEGRVSNTYEYKLQVDFSSLGATELDPETPALYDAYVKYKGFTPFNITVGYGKVPYSRSSMVGFANTPYWQRANIVRGDIFSRRDVGITLDKSLWSDRINLYAGAYTGTGEVFWQGDNDASGAFEYVGRADIAYPSRYRYQDVDTRISPVPMVALGVNARYTKRNLPDGAAFINGQTGPYGVKTIDGERLGFGFDVSAQYMGFSAQFEMHNFKSTPNKADDANLRGLPRELTGGYFRTGGWLAQANYYIKPAKTIVSARYEELDLNDLVEGNSQRFSAAVAYQLGGNRSVLKAQFFKVCREESIDKLRWNEQFRIGWMLALN